MQTHPINNKIQSDFFIIFIIIIIHYTIYDSMAVPNLVSSIYKQLSTKGASWNETSQAADFEHHTVD